MLINHEPVSRLIWVIFMDSSVFLQLTSLIVLVELVLPEEVLLLEVLHILNDVILD